MHGPPNAPPFHSRIDGGALISSGADAAPLKMAHSRAETNIAAAPDSSREPRGVETGARRSPFIRYPHTAKTPGKAAKGAETVANGKNSPASGSNA